MKNIENLPQVPVVYGHGKSYWSKKKTLSGVTGMTFIVSSMDYYYLCKKCLKTTENGPVLI
jgi:hypothetical protein